MSERRQHELEFFASSTWKEQRLDPSRLGVYALREFLQDLLGRHIERELPKVRNEIKTLLKDTEAELASLGDKRPTLAHKRMFLTRRSIEFHRLAQAALDSNYHESDSDFCDSENYSIRLRVEVHRTNRDFVALIRENSQKRKLADQDQDVYVPDCPDRSVSESVSALENYPILVSQLELDSWVKKV